VIAAGHPEVSVERRCELLGVPRANYYRGHASGLRQGDLELMRRIDESKRGRIYFLVTIPKRRLSFHLPQMNEFPA